MGLQQVVDSIADRFGGDRHKYSAVPEDGERHNDSVTLLSTIVQPVTVAYIGYLIYRVVENPNVVPVTAFILLGAIYGLQAIIFILRRKWEMIGWMILHIIAIPVFSFGLPL